MSDLVAVEDIERIVGVRRRPTEHWGRAVSDEGRVYILHSQECRDGGVDLRLCPFSIALDYGIDESDWDEDVPLLVEVEARSDGTSRLVPAEFS